MDVKFDHQRCCKRVAGTEAEIVRTSKYAFTYREQTYYLDPKVVNDISKTGSATIVLRAESGDTIQIPTTCFIINCFNQEGIQDNATGKEDAEKVWNAYYAEFPTILVD